MIVLSVLHRCMLCQTLMPHGIPMGYSVPTTFLPTTFRILINLLSVLLCIRTFVCLLKLLNTKSGHWIRLDYAFHSTDFLHTYANVEDWKLDMTCKPIVTNRRQIDLFKQSKMEQVLIIAVSHLLFCTTDTLVGTRWLDD